MLQDINFSPCKLHFESTGDNEAMFQPHWDYLPFKAYMITLIYHEKEFFISKVCKCYMTSLITLVNIHFEAMGGNEATVQPPLDYDPFKAHMITFIYPEKKSLISEVCECYKTSLIQMCLFLCLLYQHQQILLWAQYQPRKTSFNPNHPGILNAFYGMGGPIGPPL